MKKQLNTLMLLMGSLSSFAYNSAEKWSDHPKLHEVPELYQKESAVFLLERQVVDYAQEGDNSYIFNTLHRVVKVLNDQGIEAFNTVVITNYGLEVRDIKARVILPDGKVVETPKDKIKETRSESNLQQFVFALEGLKKDAEIELIYTIRYDFSLFGSEYFQSTLPILRAEFELKCPKQVEFETKGYNGFPMAKDSINTDTAALFKHVYTCFMNDIPGLREEKNSNYYANLKRVEYRIAYLPFTKPGQRLFTWNDLAKEMYENNYTYTDKELSVVRKFLKSIAVNKEKPELEKIRKIEEGIKTNIQISKDLKPESDEFENIVSSKMTSERALKRFFAACFTEAEVTHELGITSNRYTHILDEKFENWKPLDCCLFYFPNQKTYMAPGTSTSRMPFLPPEFLANKAVFCKVTTLGSTKSALGYVRLLSPMPREMSHGDIDAQVVFQGDKMQPVVSSAVAYSGYGAMIFRGAFLYTPKEQEKELVASLTDIADGMEDITSYKVENIALNNFYDNKPFVLTTVVNASKLMDKAGNKFLFKVGEVIGQQSEMYQTEERKTPVDTRFPHTLKRHIAIQIPEGYKVSNPEILNMSVLQKNTQGKEISGFVSSYKMEGKQLVIDILEYYEEMQLPVSEYAGFVKVINAAADFNKLVLVLEP